MLPFRSSKPLLFPVSIIAMPSVRVSRQLGLVVRIVSYARQHIPSLGHVTDYMYMYMRDVLRFPLFPQHGLTLSRRVGLWLLGALLLECPVLWFSSIF